MVGVGWKVKGAGGETRSAESEPMGESAVGWSKTREDGWDGSGSQADPFGRPARLATVLS